MTKSSTLSPIDDLTYDVITVLQHKAKALQAYDKYINDADEEDDTELKDLFIEMRRQDEDHIQVLKEALARRLDEDLGYDDDVDEDDEDYDEEDEDEVEPPSAERIDAAPPAGSAGATSSSARRGESSQRQR